MDPVQPESQQTIAALQAKVSGYEQEAQRTAKASAIGRVLDQYPTVPGARDQITALVAGEINVHREGDAFVATAPGFQPVETYLKERLAKPEFAHFLRSASSPTFASSTAQPSSPGSPPTLGHAMCERGVQARQEGGGDPRLNPALPLGIPTRGMRPTRWS